MWRQLNYILKQHLAEGMDRSRESLRPLRGILLAELRSCILKWRRAEDTDRLRGSRRGPLRHLPRISSIRWLHLLA